MSIKEKLLRNSRIRIGLFGFSYEITPEELLSRQSVDERIQKLEKVRQDLLDAVDAVKSLENEAHNNKKELEQLNIQLSKLREDKRPNSYLSYRNSHLQEFLTRHPKVLNGAGL